MLTSPTPLPCGPGLLSPTTTSFVRAARRCSWAHVPPQCCTQRRTSMRALQQAGHQAAPRPVHPRCRSRPALPAALAADAQQHSAVCLHVDDDLLYVVHKCASTALALSPVRQTTAAAPPIPTPRRHRVTPPPAPSPRCYSPSLLPCLPGCMLPAGNHMPMHMIVGRLCLQKHSRSWRKARCHLPRRWARLPLPGETWPKRLGAGAARPSPRAYFLPAPLLGLNSRFRRQR